MPRRTLYAAAIFLASFLLFLLEPIAGKRLLPLLGGSSAVWITCLVFFQVALLLGYLCADAIAAWLPQRVQTPAYLALLLAALVQATVVLHHPLQASTEHPVLSVFRLLTTTIGLPFVLLCATSPLLQAWYARAGDGSSPYRLFAVSNLGSLLALVFYPWLIEPHSSLSTQGNAWFVAFVVLALLTGTIAWSIRRARAPAPLAPRSAAAGLDLPPTAATRVLWLLLAACGSLLLCAVTSYFTTRVVAMPLLWIAPLVMYLASFVAAFHGRWYPQRSLVALVALAIAVLGFRIYDPDWGGSPHRVLRWLGHLTDDRIVIPLFCAGLFVACFFCHAELYRRRPHERHLTGFYLVLAAGGALGAIFVGVLAPLVFRDSYELACGLLLLAALALVITWPRVVPRFLWMLVVLGVVVLLVYQVRESRADAVARFRSFYGVLRVTENTFADDPGPRRTLYHGPTEHGSQILTPDDRKLPTTYYAEDSGVGMALELCCANAPRRVGMIGLGAGTLAAYGRPGDVFRFYEIDPLVVRVAREDFTYLSESSAHIDVVLGDARLSLLREPPQQYDVLVVDAFSGDAIPVHLLTAEAVELYRRHLKPNGILAIHVSSRYLNLAPVVQEEADHAGLGAVLIVSSEDPATFEYESDWVLLTADRGFLTRREVQDAKSDIEMPRGLRLWTDDYNSLLPIFRPED